MPYKYIKGHEVVMDEHMLSATELAKIYGLYTLNNNPNGLLVTRILADYVSSNNLNVSEYYYQRIQDTFTLEVYLVMLIVSYLIKVIAM